MIDRDAELPIKRQAQLLGISRGTVYYQSTELKRSTLELTA
jgi:putative transposase